MTERKEKIIISPVSDGTVMTEKFCPGTQSEEKTLTSPISADTNNEVNEVNDKTRLYELLNKIPATGEKASMVSYGDNYPEIAMEFSNMSLRAVIELVTSKSGGDK